MYNRTNRDCVLDEMIKTFENQSLANDFGYWEEEAIVDIINQYETELLSDKALAAAKFAVDRFPYQFEFYLIKARLLHFNCKPKKALKVLAKAETVAPFQPEIRLMKSDILSSQKNYGSSLKILNELKNEFSGQSKTELLIRESFIYESMKDFDNMFFTLKQALELDPDNNEALEQMWMSVELSKRYQESIDLHLSLIDKNPYSHLAWFNLGHAYSCMGEYEKAIDALEYSFIIDKDFESGYMDCAELCFQVKDYEKSFQIYEEVNDQFGPDAEILVYMAESLLPLKRYAEAKKYLLLALTIDPYNDEVHYYLGECYSKEGEWKKAVKAYNKAIKIEDRREEYYGSLALAHENCGNLKMADYYYKKATNVGPEQNLYWINHAKFLYTTKGPDSAYEVLKKADLFAVGADLQFYRAACLFSLNQKQEATKELAEALQEDITWTDNFLALDPKFKEDSHIMSMIRFYQQEAQSAT